MVRSEVSDSKEGHQATFTESFERRKPGRKVGLITIVLVVAAILVSVQILRRDVKKKVDTEFLERFEASFEPQLYPVVCRLGVFLRSSFNEDFSKWTLTISSTDWDRRDPSSKKDLVAFIWNAYRATRERAGGNPDEGMLVIKTEKGEKVAEASSAGVKILR